MTGWRVGYTVAHPDLIKKLSQITGQATGNICSVSQKAAVAALTGPYDCVESMRRAFQKRRDMAWKEIASWPKVVCPKPEGAFYLFIDHRDTGLDSVTFCTRLLEEQLVACVPGDDFGPSGEGHIPISYATRTANCSARFSSDNNADLRFRKSRNRKTPPVDGAFQETVCILWIGSTHGPDGC